MTTKSERGQEAHPHHQGEHERDDEGHGEADDLAGHHPLHGPAARVACQLELLADALAGVLGREPSAHAPGYGRAVGRARGRLKLGLELALHLLRCTGECLQDGDGAVHAGLLLEEATDGAEDQQQREEDQRERDDDDGAHHTSTFATLDIQKHADAEQHGHDGHQDPSDRGGVHRLDVVRLGERQVGEEGRAAARPGCSRRGDPRPRVRARDGAGTRAHGAWRPR